MGSKTKRAGRLPKSVSENDAAVLVNSDLEDECPSVDTCSRSGKRCTASRAEQCPFYATGSDTDNE
jgi:hypothetical protein